jgi:hypothetical protein
MILQRSLEFGHSKSDHSAGRSNEAKENTKYGIYEGAEAIKGMSSQV